MKRTVSVFFAALICIFTALCFAGCSDDNNSLVVGEWEPTTVSINGTTISYSELDTTDKDFRLYFYSDGKCKVKIGGVSNEGSYTFNETSVDIQYGSKSQKLSYDHGILTMKLNYHNQTTLYMFTKVTG